MIKETERINFMPLGIPLHNSLQKPKSKVVMLTQGTNGRPESRWQYIKTAWGSQRECSCSIGQGCGIHLEVAKPDIINFLKIRNGHMQPDKKMGPLWRNTFSGKLTSARIEYRVYYN